MPPLDPAHAPAAVVQRQLDAYNARDVDALLATYAPDAEHFEHPATLIARGADELRRRFTARFAEPNLHAALLHRAVLGNLVVDYERVTRTFPEGPGSVELVATYEVKDGRIARAWFIFGAKALGS
ncbi:MAG TPA: nuclear transport factor 2 family protein [Opitutaceae bacterium]